MSHNSHSRFVANYSHEPSWSHIIIPSFWRVKYENVNHTSHYLGTPNANVNYIIVTLIYRQPN